MATLHIDTELFKLKNSLQEMWLLVDKQLTKAQIAFMEYDKSIAREILSREKMVNALELKIDSECENFIARNNPVAIDLRLALAYIKINNNLERIGDFAEGIAEFVLRNMSEKLPIEFAEKLRIEEMFNGVSEMFNLAKESLHEENSSKAEKIFGLDNLVDEINHRSNLIITEEMKKHPEKIEEYLYLNAVIRKLERMGDRCNNIAEEIVFYLDAKILKHNKSV
ncbi:Phosphate-specific transport system accessory protein PhoU [bioreactor metagenome]|jgi:phosphate transport system protein|uniref:Phosphate-specific transport system accessory protein PhoU n=1 Tax=bioreactor metagenome TaxID=1076179 RepID=A0A644TSI5_9ZZZZ|nr:phosphate signaling complex protein PhoU [Bacteroidales bacterium]MDD3667575.1 phosphate signaling complex protein PhoU [Bacteroidales bacterium]MDY4790513.1 phosphate signaling complex protein PhoU [Bacteroidales bacterium]MEA4968225.1 phosphate signaling complex protein PhoU [Bacteroidaceae bacterium]MEA5099378.1 phosphate signaling complex protein PhoU [Bacteroidales bacterium]